MKRIISTPRKNWQKILENQEFFYHSIDDKGNDMSGLDDKFYYWREDVAYEFEEKEIIKIQKATEQLHQMCIEAARHLIEKGDLSRIFIPAYIQDKVAQSFLENEMSLYGRFDLAYNGSGEPKMFEYNADTATSIVESAVIQYYWAKDVYPQQWQFNSLQESFIKRFTEIKNTYNTQHMHFTCYFETMEDIANTEYLIKCAKMAGLDTTFFNIRDISFDDNGNFLDNENYIVDFCYKLVPLETLFQEPLYYLNAYKNNVKWIEPLWKSILSNKALLAILWELFPKHPNLLETHFYKNTFFGNFVQKPVFSREGNNIRMFKDYGILDMTKGETGKNFIYQELYETPAFDSPEKTGWLDTPVVYPSVGSWVVGDKSVCLSIREDVSRITKSTAYFVPHIVK